MNRNKIQTGFAEAIKILKNCANLKAQKAKFAQ
jgi:hypothetical protein